MKSQSKILLVGVLAFVALTYFIWNTYKNSQNAESIRQWVDHSYQLMEKIDRLSAAVSQLESDGRGWLLTQNSVFAQDADKHISETKQLLGDLRKLTADNPSQQRKIESLETLINQKVQFHLQQLKWTNGEKLQQHPVRGRELMDALSNQLESFRATETTLLRNRLSRDREFVDQSFLTTLAGTIAALIFIAIILWQLNKDISRRKKAEQQLQQIQHRLQAILDNIPLIIHVKDLEGRYLLANKKFKETHSYSDEMIIGKTDYEVEPKRAEDFERRAKQVIETLKPVEFDDSMTVNDETRHYHYVKFPLLDRSGKLFATGAFGVDFTERKKAAEQLQRSEQQMRALLSSTNEGIFMVNRDYELILINEAGKEIVNFTTGRDTQVGENVKDIVAEDKKDSLIEVFEKFFKGEEVEYEDIYNKDGEERVYLVSFLPAKEDGRIVAAVVLSKDITDLVKYRRQLIDARRKAERAEKSQEQFLANISHEIRTPLNGIIGMANLLQKTSLNEEQRDFVSIIKFSSDNLLVLINDILDFSKIKAGKLNIEKIDFNIWDIVQKAVSALQQKAKEKDLGLLIFFHDDVPRLIKGDPYRLNQILSNLLSNAIKFTQKGYIRIEISCRRYSPGWCKMRFKVSDTGIGIATEKLAMIFESFSQASEDVTRKFGGTGLGLTITKQLVELQAGNIRVESEEGVGTSVTFEVPYEMVEEAMVEQQSLPELDHPEYSSFHGKRIMVVEDNEINRKVIAYNLEPAGIELTMANDGKEAVQILETGENFDLIIMDLQMPAMNGFQATVYIRQKLKLQTPIIAMTASALKNEEVKCFELGMNEYLTKPFAPEELFRVLDSYLSQKPHERVVFSEKKDRPAYTLDYISIKRKPEVIAHVLGIILQEAPKMLHEISGHILNEEWTLARDKAHKLKSSIGLLQAQDLFELLNKIELQSGNEKHAEDLPILIETAIEKFNLLRPMLEAEHESALHVV